MKLLFRIVIFTLAVIAATYFVGGVFLQGLVPALIAGLILSIIHITIKPVLLVVTLPINVVTFGLFSLILNAVFFWFVSTLINGFSVVDFMSAFWGAVVVSIINALSRFIID